MVNLLAEDGFIKNDNSKRVAVEECSVRWYVATTANIKPGYPVRIVKGTSTGVEETAAVDALNPSGIIGVAEFDPLQIASCAVAYAANDLIPVILFVENRGKILRNLYANDPNAAIEKEQRMTVGLTGFVVSTSPTGSYVRTYAYTADPGADFRFAGRID